MDLIFKSDSTVDGLELLEKVNAFYSGAYDDLSQLMVTLVVIVGGLVPLVISVYQNKFNAEQLSKMKSEAMVEIRQEIDDKIQTLEKRFRSKLANQKLHAMSSTNLGAGLTFLQADQYAEAIAVLLVSAEGFLSVGDENLFRAALDQAILISNRFPDIDYSYHEITENFNRVKKSVKKVDSLWAEYKVKLKLLGVKIKQAHAAS